jgi:hypothetical protein
MMQHDHRLARLDRPRCAAHCSLLAVVVLPGCTGGAGSGASATDAATLEGADAVVTNGSDAAGGDSGGANGRSDAAVPDAASGQVEADAAQGSASEAGASDAGDAGDAGHAADGSTAEPTGVFVAVGYGGRRMRSVDDGQSFVDDQSLEANGGDDNDLLRTVAFGPGGFLAAGWQLLSSPDGKTWSALPPTHQNWFGALVYADSTWVAVGGYGMRLTSGDGMTWTDHSLDTTAAHPHGCLAFTGSSPAFAACNDNGARSYSADGVTWSYATGAEAVVSSQVVAGAGVVAGVDGAQVVVSKDNGQTWTQTTALDQPGGGLVFAQGHFTYLSTSAVYTSTDGTTWEKHAAPGIQPSALAYGHGTYVAVRAHDWQRSADGITWGSATHDTSKDNGFEWVAFGALP